MYSYISWKVCFPSHFMSPHLQLSASHWAQPNGRTLHLLLSSRGALLNIAVAPDFVIPFVSTRQT